MSNDNAPSMFSMRAQEALAKVIVSSEAVSLRGNTVVMNGGLSDTIKNYIEGYQIDKIFSQNSEGNDLDNFNPFVKKSAFILVFKKFLNNFLNERRKEQMNILSENQSEVKKLSEENLLEYSTCEIVQDIRNPAVPYALLLTSGKIAIEANMDVLADIKQITTKELWTVSTQAKIVFEPHRERRWIAMDNDLGMETNFVNLYNPPSWRSMNVKPSIHPHITKLIEHLFKNEDRETQIKNIEYAFFWIKTLLTSRNETMLSLTGNRGIGKGIFSRIVSALAGGNNTSIIRDTMLEKDFNAPLAHKTLCLFDEVNINSQEKKDALKFFCNNKISLEKKGKDQVTIENFNSYILMTNSLTGLGIDPSDRRYSVPELNHEDLSSSMSEYEITDLLSFCEKAINGEDVVEIAQFGNWILNFKPNPSYGFSKYKPLKGKQFFSVCEASLKGMRKVVRDVIVSKELPYYTFEYIKEEFKECEGVTKEVRISRQDICSFLHEYKHEGIHILGKVSTVKVIKHGSRNSFREIDVVIPSKEFLPIDYREGESCEDYLKRMELKEMNSTPVQTTETKSLKQKALEKANKNKVVDDEDIL